MKAKKIWVAGGVAAGKTTFAKELTKKTGLPLYHLDQMIYSKNYKIRYSEKRRNKKLKEISNKKRWIIEGTNSREWIIEGLKKAELIIFLDVGTIKRTIRVIKRHIKESKWKEKDGLLRVLGWTTKYALRGKKRHRKMIDDHNKQVIILKNNKEIKEFLEGIPKK